MSSARPALTQALTQARLKELLHYDPETGHFTWLANQGRARAGQTAGTTDKVGYVVVRVAGRFYKAHRLAFLYMRGEIPPDDVDHINRVKGDNCWRNLRLATRPENLANIGLLRSNTSGYRGVSWRKSSGRWQAFGSRDRRRVHLGFFDDLIEAATAAQKWREENFGIFAVAGQPGLASVVS